MAKPNVIPVSFKDNIEDKLLFDCSKKNLVNLGINLII